MSEIDQLRAELSRQQSLNNEYRQMIYEIESGVSHAYSQLSNYKNKVANSLADSHQRITNSHSAILEAYEIQGQIDTMYVKFKNMELANKKIRECNNKKYYDFANYRNVRKLVQGIMDNMNIQMVSDDIIYKSIEKQHLMTPDYWLTCVLISIMAWKNDDKDLADRATARAIQLDKKNSAIFYMLFNIRVNRDSAALKWFDLYQTCDLKGSDERTFLLLFSLLSKTIDEEVDDHIKYEIYDFVNKVIALNAQSEGFNEEEIIDKIVHELSFMRKSEAESFNLLKTCCDDYSDISLALSLAANNKNILQFLLDIDNVSQIQKNKYLSDFIDEEISKPNDAELSVNQEIEYNEYIIKYNGDIDSANEYYNQEQERKAKSLNLISEMIKWIYAKGNDEINGQVKKNVFVLTGILQKQAIEKYIANYRNMIKNNHPVTLGDYRTNMDFNNKSLEEQKIENYFNEQANSRKSAIKNINMIVSICAAIACAIGGIMVSYYLFIGTGIGIIACFISLFYNNKMKKQIDSDCELNIKSKKELLFKLFEEYEQLRLNYKEYDAYQNNIFSQLSKM